jgi:hypothetical protein
MNELRFRPDSLAQVKTAYNELSCSVREARPGLIIDGKGCRGWLIGSLKS